MVLKSILAHSAFLSSLEQATSPFRPAPPSSSNETFRLSTLKVNIPMRIAKQITTIVLTVGMLSCMPRILQAQNDAQRAAILQKLQEKFTLTKITNDRSDIVTPGSVLVLDADGLIMY